MSQKCRKCGQTSNLPYQCSKCEDYFCSNHRLPENHDCPMLQLENVKNNEESNSSGFIPNNLTTDIANYVPLLDDLMGSASYAIIIIILLVYATELIVLHLYSEQLFRKIFVLYTLSEPWSIITSVFSHNPQSLFHIFGNSIVLLFFGPQLERRIGTKRFIVLFLVAGIASALPYAVLQGSVLGASGAISAIVGVTSLLKPDMTVRLYFVLPLKLKNLVVIYALISVIGVFTQIGGIAHIAHLIGLLSGVLYGAYISRDDLL